MFVICCEWCFVINFGVRVFECCINFSIFGVGIVDCSWCFVICVCVFVVGCYICGCYCVVVVLNSNGVVFGGDIFDCGFSSMGSWCKKDSCV